MSETFEVEVDMGGPPAGASADYTDEYDYPEYTWAPQYLPNDRQAAIRCIRHNADCVRKSVAMSVGTIRSLSQESLDELHQVMENTSLMVMDQVEVIRKVMKERERA